ncbi:MAG TPA: SusE domain-containing protein, partial [Pyrinomonadaceae bacterium]|nr:SusE domain-containing protein [Pyrinomonadaceae bacterium]
MNCLFALNVRKPFVFLSSLALVVPALFFASARLGDGALSPSAHAARFTARDGARKQTPVRRPDFVENRGQWETPARFVARVGEVTAAFEPSAIRLRLGREPSATLGLVFEGASSRATLAGERRREGRYNFLVGPRASWRSNVAAYESVLYQGLYEGVRVRAREEAGRLEYDLLLDAGASLEAVRLRAEGADALELGDDGSLLVRVGQEVLRQTPPRTWEVLPGGARRTVECRFRLLDAHSYGFEAQRSDTTLPLVIDPGLEWATYMGGGRQEEIYDVASANDGTGDSISVGVTMSPDFSGRVQPVSGFVVRFNSAGALVYKTILGGSDREWIRAVAVASGGQPVVVGESYSPDYPTTPNAYDTTHAVGADSRPGADAFVTRLSADGSQLVFSTFIGTSEHEQALAVALSPTGAVYLAGETASNAFPTTSGAYDRTHNCCTPFGAGSFSIQDAFVARLSADGSALEYSTYFGGHGDEIPTDLVVDSSGFVTFTGITYSPPSGGPAMPTTSGALRTTPASGSFNPDAFIVRMKLDGEGTSDLRYSSFLGGTDTDEGYAVALDPTDPTSVIVGGITYSTVSAIRFPTTPGTLRPTSDSIDGFVMRFRFPATGGGSLVWSTLFGGFLYEEVSDVAVEPSGAIVIAGQTHSFDLPTTTGAHDRSVGITTGLLFFDAYVARLSPDGAALLYGTYLGGNHDDWHVKLALTGASMATVAGWTQSANFPASSFAFDPLLNNGGTGGPAAPTDAFVARIDLRPDGDGDDTVSAPTLLNPAPGAAAGMNTVINFDWTDVPDPSGIDGYHIQLNRRPDFACCDDWQEVWTKNSEWLATVRFDGTYYWRVQTADNSGNLSEWSEVRALNAGIGLSTVSVNPSSVTGGNSAQGQVTLSGLAPSGGASVSLSSSNPSAAAVPASVQIASGSPSANFNVTTNSAVASSTSVTISASYSGTTRTTTLTVLPRTSAPSAPTLLSPANNVRLPPNTSLTFTWSAASGATSYEIQVDDSSSFSAPLVISSRPTQTQHVLSLSSERRYWWRVRGVNAGGTAGPFSSSRTFEIRRGAPAPPPPPGPVTLSTLALSPT